MFSINDDFLVEAGLGEMPAHHRSEFLRLVYETLQERVGTALSDGMSDAQLEEFSLIIARDPARVAIWIEENAPDFLSDPIYSGIQKMFAGQEDPAGIVCEYASTKWLDISRPDYRDVVAQELNALKAELVDRGPQILAACEQPA